jgi:transposase InsO family protein
VCGPIATETPNGKKYFITFMDDYSRMVWVRFMRTKDEAFEKFREFAAMMNQQWGQGIGTLRTDNGGEFTSEQFEAYLRQRGIRHQKTVPRSPQQNGVAERMNRTLMEMTRSMLLLAGHPKHLWAEALNAAAYVRNRLPTASTQRTPYEMWYDRIPDVSHLKIWGCVAYAKEERADKLDARGEKLRFVGYEERVKGYHLWDEEK